MMYADGYKYWFAFKTDKTSYYRCSRYIRSKCPGKCTNEDGRIKQQHTHNHPPELNRILVDKFRKVLTHRACTENTELYAIYCDEATNRHTDAALLYPFSSAESAMRKARRKQLPRRTPQSVDDIIDELDNTDLFRVKSGSDRDPLYQKTLMLEDSVCMIFLHRKTISLFNRIDELHVDGSYEFVMENQPNFLITFHAVQGQITSPIIYAISTSKTQTLYNAIFSYVRDELKIHPNVLISDYDSTMQSSLGKIFPGTIIKGCWFHYTDAVLSQMDNLNMKKECKRGNGASGLRMFLVLPLLPPEYMVPGLDSIRKWMKEKTIFSEGFSTLSNYIEQSWLRAFGTEKMSIFGTTRIASNHLRNFNRELSELIGQQSPTFWIILDALTQIATKMFVKTTRKLRFVKQTNEQQQDLSQSKNNNSDDIDSMNIQQQQSQQQQHPAKCTATINSFDLTNQTQPILQIPRTLKRSELVSETIITSATQLWVKTPVHLRNSLQFLQLISHCINDSMYLANLTDIKERNYLPAIASDDNLKKAVDAAKNPVQNININDSKANNNNSNNNDSNIGDNNINNNGSSNNNGSNSNSCVNNAINKNSTEQHQEQTCVAQQSYVLQNENLNNINNSNSITNSQIIEMIDSTNGVTDSTSSPWASHLANLQTSPSSPTLSFVLQEGTFNCTEITHQEYLLAQPGQAQQQNTYTSCFAQNNFNINELDEQQQQQQQQQQNLHHHSNMNMQQQQEQQQQQNLHHSLNRQQQDHLFNFDNMQSHNHHHHENHQILQNNSTLNSIRPMLHQQNHLHQQQIQQQTQQQHHHNHNHNHQQQQLVVSQQSQPQQQISLPVQQRTEPPPLVFFKSVKRRTEPPPLVFFKSIKR